MSTMYLPLRERWLSLFSENASKEAISRVYDELVVHYSEIGRHYHTTMHVEDMLNVIDEMLAIYHIESESTDKQNLHFAAWFHDVVQKPDNAPVGYTVVEASADFAVNAIRACGNDSVHQCNTVYELIMLTNKHVVDPSLNVDEMSQKIFLDADLAILGSEWEKYRQYATDIASEFSHLPERAYRVGRTDFLNNMIMRERIFNTEYMQELYGQRAIDNMKRELGFLYGLNAQDLIDDINPA